jgi:hypothetical protein
MDVVALNRIMDDPKSLRVAASRAQERELYAREDELAPKRRNARTKRDVDGLGRSLDRPGAMRRIRARACFATSAATSTAPSAWKS